MTETSALPTALPVTERTRIRREAQRQVTDRAALYTILDEGWVAHVAFVRDGQPVVIPFGYARDGDSLLLHGSTGGGIFRGDPAGIEVSVGVTHLDGLVYARSIFESSMNYRSAVIFGRAVPVPEAERDDAFRAFSEHLMPGRWDEVRAMTRKEKAATQILRVAFDEASVKIREGDIDEKSDEGEDRTVWAGVLPFATRAGAPVSSKLNANGAKPSPSVAAVAARLDA